MLTLLIKRMGNFRQLFSKLAQGVSFSTQSYELYAKYSCACAVIPVMHALSFQRLRGTRAATRICMWLPLESLHPCVSAGEDPLGEDPLKFVLSMSNQVTFCFRTRINCWGCVFLPAACFPRVPLPLFVTHECAP